MTETLTRHLIKEIIIRGAGGGPLSPLASQLNHDLTHLQGDRLDAKVAQLAINVREALARLDQVATPTSQPDTQPVGAPLSAVTDPFALGVHRPIRPRNAASRLPDLPVYMPREHDDQLAQLVTAASEGTSGIAVLVGGSSTGKTRACWEALRLLRTCPSHGGCGIRSTLPESQRRCKLTPSSRPAPLCG